MEDLKRLYLDGLPVSIGDCQYVLHGGLIAFLADTLAAHSVGGFKGVCLFLFVCVAPAWLLPNRSKNV